MRVMLVHYNPGQGGGAESALRDQKQALELLGHEVWMVFQHPSTVYAEIKPDIIHFHTIHVEMGLQVLRWAQKEKIPHCLSLHDYWPFCFTGRMLLKTVAAISLQPGTIPFGIDDNCPAVNGLCDPSKCEHHPTPAHITSLVNNSPTVTFNPYSAEILRRNGVRIDAVIPHSIDTDFFKPDYSKRDGVTIMAHSAWPQYATKGMHYLSAALKRIDATAKCWSGVSREKIRDELQKATIHVFPSVYQETYGLCLGEAMACGCACIAADVAGPRYQIKHGETGILVPPRDIGLLAGAIYELLEKATLRERLGKNARDWSEEHACLGRMGKDYERFYATIL